jgi:hypothetical protein
MSSKCTGSPLYNCLGHCYGLECSLGPDQDLMTTRVEPLFGQPFEEKGGYIPTWRELFVGRRVRYGLRIRAMRFLRRVR